MLGPHRDLLIAVWLSVPPERIDKVLITLFSEVDLVNRHPRRVLSNNKVLALIGQRYKSLLRHVLDLSSDLHRNMLDVWGNLEGHKSLFVIVELNASESFVSLSILNVVSDRN